MSRQKIYTEEFLVRATAEELRLVDDLATGARVSRSRLVIISALSGQSAPVAESFALQERMVELRLMALVELRRTRAKLERLTDIRQQPRMEVVEAAGTDVAETIKELRETIRSLRNTWGCEQLRK